MNYYFRRYIVETANFDYISLAWKTATQLLSCNTLAYDVSHNKFG